MTVRMVTVDEIKSLQSTLEILVGDVIEEDGRFSFDDISNGLFDGGNLQAWLVSNDKNEYVAAAITCIVDYPKRSDLCVLFLQGVGMSKWISHLEDELYKFAHYNECSFVQAGGRKGWGRVLSKFGYVQKYITLQKAVK